MKNIFWKLLFLYSIGHLSWLIFEEYFNETTHYSEIIDCNKLSVHSSWLENEVHSYNAVVVARSLARKNKQSCNMKALITFSYGESRSERTETVKEVHWPTNDSLLMISQLKNGRIDTFSRCLSY